MLGGRDTPLIQGIAFGILFMFWVILSGYFDAFHLIAGVICSSIVTLISYDLLFDSTPKKAHIKVYKFIIYLFWLYSEIFRSGLDVAYRVLSPSMPIDPSIITFETPFASDMSQTMMANSITLTPGTLTLDVRDGRFIVHSLCPKFSCGLLEERTMQKKLEDIFSEGA